MKLKRLLTFLIVFALGIGLGVVITHHPTSPMPRVLYRSEAYFSPNGDVALNIIKTIDSTGSSIDLAIFDITSQDIGAALEKARKRGVSIRIIADSRQAKGSHSVVQPLIDAGFNIKIRHGKGRGIMHNKFAIFDGKLMVTGSYNWTHNAEQYNYENAIFISDPEIIKKYQREFDKIWAFDIVPY